MGKLDELDPIERAAVEPWRSATPELREEWLREVIETERASVHADLAAVRETEEGSLTRRLALALHRIFAELTAAHRPSAPKSAGVVRKRIERLDGRREESFYAIGPVRVTPEEARQDAERLATPASPSALRELERELPRHSGRGGSLMPTHPNLGPALENALARLRAECRELRAAAKRSSEARWSAEAALRQIRDRARDLASGWQEQADWAEGDAHDETARISREHAAELAAILDGEGA
jgi:hypothetical protein